MTSDEQRKHLPSVPERGVLQTKPGTALAGSTGSRRHGPLYRHYFYGGGPGVADRLAAKLNQLRYQAHVIPAMGGDAQPVLPSSYPEGQPTWSPDSTQVAFGEMLNTPAEPASEMRIHVVNVQTHQSTVLPGFTVR